MPLTHLAPAFRDRRFLIALLTGNFILVPLIVGALLLLLPDDPAIRLGVLLVLLVPCTDWFISFTHLGGGNGARAIAAAPVLLIFQLVLLPVYIWVFMGDLAIELAVGSYLLPVFFGLIITPLILAWLTERLAERHQPIRNLVDRLGWLPVPLVALVVFLNAGSQVGLYGVFWINVLMFAGELGAGLWADSKALIADSADNLGGTVVYAMILFVVSRSLRWKASAAFAKGLIQLAFGIGIVASTVAAVLLHTAYQVLRDAQLTNGSRAVEHHER